MTPSRHSRSGPTSSEKQRWQICSAPRRLQPKARTGIPCNVHSLLITQTGPFLFTARLEVVRIQVEVRGDASLLHMRMLPSKPWAPHLDQPKTSCCLAWDEEVMTVRC